MTVRSSVRLLAGTACAATVLLTTGAPALAAGAAPPALPALVTHVADHLRTDPVYLSDAFDRTAPPSVLLRLEASVRKATGYHVYAVLMPVFRGSGSPVPDAPTALSFVHSALGRPGVYVLSTGSGDVDAEAFGVDAPAQDAADVARYESGFFVPPATMVERFVDVLLSGTATTRAQYDVQHSDALDKKREASPDPDRATWDSLTGAIGAIGAAVVLVGLLVWRRGAVLLHGTGVAAAAGLPPGATPAPLEPPDPDALTAGAAAALTRLQHRLSLASKASAPTNAAFDDAAAADRLLAAPAGDARERTCRAVAAQVLARQAGQRLDGHQPVRPCFFHPLHDGRTAPVAWRDGAGHEAQVPACHACATALAAGHRPDVLVLPAGRRRVRPWYAAGCAPLWARTGFGSLRDDLATQVLSELPSAVEERS